MILCCRCVLAWGVSLPPQNPGHSAKSNCWVPLAALRCGNTEITAITVSGKYLVVGDDSGNVVVWDCEDETAANLREIFRTDVQQRVTSLFIDPTGLFFVVGTQDGQLFGLTDWSRQTLRPIEGIRQLPGLTGAISFIFCAPYWKETLYEQAAYILFSSGAVVIVSLPSLELRAYSGLIKIDTDDGADADETGAATAIDERILFGFVLNTKYEPVTMVTEEMQANIPVTNAQSTAPPQPPPAESKSFMKKLKRTSGESITLPPMAIPRYGPRYLVYVRGRNLIKCDLSTFSRPIISSLASPSSASSSSNSISATSGASSLTWSAISHPVLIESIQISSQQIITCELLSYIEDATRFWSKPILTLSFIDAMSDITFVTLKSHFVLNSHNLLPNVLTEPYNITDAVILSNGCSYLCSNRNIIYSIHSQSVEYLLSSSSAYTPSQAEMTSISPESSQMLCQREVVETNAKAKSKRRSSFLTLPSAGVDLDKLFLKTFDPKQKDDLFRRYSLKSSSSATSEAKEEYVIRSDNVKDTNKSTARTKAILDETRANFEERGERINILNKRAEDFSNDAAIYKAASAAHKEKMKLKAQRWGVF
jgi:hypothetical protein